LAFLEKLFQERERKKHLNNGVTLIAPETVFFSYDTQIESDVEILQYVVFLEGVYIKSGARIGPFCSVEGAKIGDSQVGPFARLRNGSDIGNGVKIGNFVEIKNSVVSEQSKVCHLSYIGDAIIGKSVNVGAGTITCNYDGVNKHKTTIGDNVFIGSNSALIAPVEIKDNAVIGAGSVIVKNVESNALAIARSDQKNVENWVIRKKKKCAES
jgi:bifunctional UDP-N-acetylglucosamine pyrophosphorylase/glucosamine-1-phosphate N-acetyltransferase